MMKRGIELCVGVAVAFLAAVSFFSLSWAEVPGHPAREKILKSYGQLPLYFIENKGQLNPKVRFYVKTAGQALYFTDGGVVFDLFRNTGANKKTDENLLSERGNYHQAPNKMERLVFTLGFDTSARKIVPKGLDRQSAVINHFVGNDKSKWKTDIPTYKGIMYKGVYKGIDLRVYGTGKHLEYEFIVHPGGNPQDILLTYHGIEGLGTSPDGELLIATAFGQLKETKPYIYQEINGKKVVAGSFHIKSPTAKSQTQKYSYGFTVASYDPSYPLIIDPTLIYSTYLGKSGLDFGQDVAVDDSGYAYVAGGTDSTNFSMAGTPYKGTYGGGTYDGFVTKFNASGSDLVYSTFLGGAGKDWVQEIAIDGSGNAYLTGYTDSNDFPAPGAAYQGTYGGGTYDGFVTKLNASGSGLVYSTYLGGSSEDYGTGIAVDGSGYAYVTGSTYSNNFPTENAYDASYNGETDAFVTKVGTDGSSLSYSTYLGGGYYDWGNEIAIDGDGNAYVTGYSAHLSGGSFPITPGAYQTTCKGSYDAFITKFNFSGSTLTLVYSTYLGGELWDEGTGIAVDSSGNAYVTGYTASFDFPTAGTPYQGLYGDGPYDVFVAKLNTDGTDLVYSTYLGGTGDDRSRALAIDGSGYAYVTGWITSADFPTKNPYQGGFGGGDCDAFVTKLNTDGTDLVYSTYLGGTGDDEARGIAVDGSGNAYVAGLTGSTDFPTADPYQGTYGDGTRDAFLLKYNGESGTLVQMVSFAAQGLSDSVRLSWETASEKDNAGFHVWRSSGPDEEYTRMTDTLIPAQGGFTWGARYEYVDQTAVPGITYSYKLEDADTSGNGSFHGPVSAWVGVVNIQAGDCDEPATAAEDQPVSVKVAVQAGDYVGTPVEYWVAAHTPFGWYSYGAQGWSIGMAPAAVGPLADVAPLEVVDFPLVPGWYTFYLAVDDRVNGQPDVTWINAVEVEVK